MRRGTEWGQGEAGTDLYGYVPFLRCFQQGLESVSCVLAVRDPSVVEDRDQGQAVGDEEDLPVLE